MYLFYAIFYIIKYLLNIYIFLAILFFFQDNIFFILQKISDNYIVMSIISFYYIVMPLSNSMRFEY